jgi:hypothetical protein
VPQSIGEHVTDVVVGESVVDDPARLPTFDHPAGTKEPELMANRRLSHPDEEREIAYAELLREAERVQDPRTVRIGEQAEDLRDAVRLREPEYTVKERGDVLGVDALGLASLGRKLDT